MNQQTEPKEKIVLTVTPEEFETIRKALCLLSGFSAACMGIEGFTELSAKLTDQKDEQLPKEKRAALIDKPSLRRLRLVKR